MDTARPDGPWLALRFQFSADGTSGVMDLFLNIFHGQFLSLSDIAFQQVMSPALLPRFPLSIT